MHQAVAIEKMSLAEVTGDLSKLDEVLFRCLMMGSFQPEEASTLGESAGGFAAVVEENPYLPLLNQAVRIGTILDTSCQEKSTKQAKGKIHPPDDLPNSVGRRLEDLTRKQRYLLQKLEENKERIQDLGEFQGQQIGINHLHSCTYLKIRFGILPLEKDLILAEHKGDPFLFAPICQEGGDLWGVYFTTDEHVRLVDEFFATLGFERIWMPQLNSEKTQNRIAAWTQFLAEYQQELSNFVEQKKQLTAEIERYENALTILHHVEELDVSFDDLFSCEFLKIRFGRLPSDSFDKLSYYEDRAFLFLSFDQDEQYHWGVIFTTKDHEAEIDEIFSSLYFERVKIPQFAHGTPDTACKDIREQLEHKKLQKKQLEAKLQECRREHKEKFYDIYAMIKYLSESFGIRKYVGRVENTFRMIGFLPEKEAEQFRENLEAVEEVQVECMPPESDKRLTVPTKLKNNWFAKPFELFLDLYGRPSYTDIDPTPLFAVSYTLLFGIMFGDLGQGLVIALFGLFLSHKNGSDFGKILTRIGCSSAVFGFAYGSFFGLEEVLDPVFRWMGFAKKPIEVMNPDTITLLLLGAVALGVMLILVSMLTNIVSGFRQRDYEKAIFSSNGIAGMVFYLSVLIAAVMKLAFEVNLFTPLYILGLIVLPLLLIFLKEPLGRRSKKSQPFLPEGGMGEFLLEGFFELFEVVLSFVSNTMSFLRVGGFIISHAGMMAVVMTLSGIFQGLGSVITLILGNLFVMGLEGFIVGIQCLRLEFYEMFSRYFQGEGEPFTPVSAKSLVDLPK